MKSTGIGIIGLGYIGQVHLRHSLKLTHAHLVGVSDLSQRALSVAKDLGVRKTHDRYQKLLKDPEVDAVVVALPTHLHLQCAKEAAEAKKHILLEKPIAGTITEAKEIVFAAQKNSVKLMIGYPLRFNSEFRDLKEKTRCGILGDVEVAHASYISSGPFFHRAIGYAPTPVPEWWFNKELTGGGVLIDLGSHLINYLRWCLGEVIDVKSYLGHRFNMNLEDSATCLMKFDSGTTAVLSVGWFSQQHLLKIQFMGSVKHASAEHSPSNPFATVAQILTSGVSKFYWPHFAELQYFVQCVTDDSPPSPSGQDGLKDLDVISRAYKNEMSQPNLER